MLPDDFGIDLLRSASNGRVGACLIAPEFGPDRAEACSFGAALPIRAPLGVEFKL